MKMGGMALDINNVMFMFFMIFFFLMGRVIYVLMGVYLGVKTLSEYSRYEEALKSLKAKKIQREIKELSVLIVIIFSVGFAMLLTGTK